MNNDKNRRDESGFGTSSSADNHAAEIYREEMNCRLAAGDIFGGDTNGE